MTIEQRAQELLAAAEAHRDIFLDVHPDRVLTEARAADVRHAAGMVLSDVDGQFLAVKANIDVQDMRSHAASLAYTPKPAQADAPIVAQLRAAGAIVLGHVNMSEFAFSGLGVNPHYGTPQNALDAALVPGGSSSGSASAVALGLADIALGTDTSGSVRIPAACQGLVGFRPTMGRYKDSGIVPLAPSLDTPGPLAPSVDHIHAMDTVLVARHENGIQCKDIICLDDASLAATHTADIAASYQTAIDALCRHGFRIQRRPFDSFERVTALFEQHGTLVGAEAFPQLFKLFEGNTVDLDPNVSARLAKSVSVSRDDLRALLDGRRSLMRSFADEVSGAMLLYPTLLSPPPTVQSVTEDPATFAEENARILSVSMKAAFLNAPTISLPADANARGFSLSLTGTSGRDADVLATASALEAVFQNL